MYVCAANGGGCDAYQGIVGADIGDFFFSTISIRPLPKNAAAFIILAILSLLSVVETSQKTFWLF